MGDRVYLDWNATAPLRPAARAAMLEALDEVGNPSSVHAEGQRARMIVEDAREAVARLVGGRARDVVFTSGGTEANAMALTPHLYGPRGKGLARLLISAVEHASVLSGGQFPADSVRRIAVTADGVLDLGDLDKNLDSLKKSGERGLVSVMLANNETGVVQPIAAIAERVHWAGSLLHVDAVQAAGKIPIDIKALQTDLMTVSGHKFGAPKGVGALIQAPDTQVTQALIRGGGQERGLRAGTENVAAIAGMGAAATEIVTATADIDAHHRYLRRLRDRLELGLRQAAPATVIFGEAAERLSNTALFAIEGVKAETALIAFDLAGIAVSSGSACSSGKVTASHVLAAMGVRADLAAGAIRVSFGLTSGEADIDRFLEAWTKLVAHLNKTSQKDSRGPTTAARREVKSEAGTTP